MAVGERVEYSTQTENRAMVNLKPYIRALLGLLAFGLLCVAIGLTLPSGSYTAKAPTQVVTVERVIDGDTVELAGIGSCRMAGIDAPETKGSRWPDQPFAMAAKQYLIKRLDGAHVTAIVGKRDKYGRPLVTLYAGPLCVNEDMVDAGLAWSYGKDYLAVEEHARKGRYGLFCCGDEIKPGDWRRGKRAKVTINHDDD